MCLRNYMELGPELGQRAARDTERAKHAGGSLSVRAATDLASLAT